MSWKESDSDDSQYPWSDPEGDGWKGDEEEGEEEFSEEELLAQNQRYADCGDLILESDFLILQMITGAREEEETARLLHESLSQVKARIEAIIAFLREWWECSDENLPDLMEDISICGHHQGCSNPDCHGTLQNLDCFCCFCGTRNPHFNLRYFWLVNGMTLSEMRAVECKNDHPLQKDRQLLHCELCGKALNPDPSTSPD